MIVRPEAEAGKPPVILCDGNDTEAAQLSRLLAPHYNLSLASAPMDALKNLVSSSFRSMVLSLQADDPSFLELIPLVKKLRPKLPIIVIADGGSLEEQRTVQKQGIFYFVPRPVASKEILSALANAVAKGSGR
jgi:DNA-binding NtrC family response regulator